MLLGAILLLLLRCCCCCCVLPRAAAHCHALLHATARGHTLLHATARGHTLLRTVAVRGYGLQRSEWPPSPSLRPGAVAVEEEAVPPRYPPVYMWECRNVGM